MIFKDLTEGSDVFVLNRTDIEASQARCVKKRSPYIDAGFRGTAEMVVDITIEYNGMQKTFTLKDGTEVGYASDLVIATSRDYIIKEIESIKKQAERELAQTERNKANVCKCEALLEEMNPTIKEKKENEERFSKLETSINEIAGLVKGLVSELKGQA